MDDMDAGSSRIDRPRRSKIVRSVLWFLVLFEISPVSHVLRAAAFSSSQVAGGGRTGGAISYGLSTLIIQAGAAFASVRLVESSGSDTEKTPLKFRIALDRFRQWMAARGPLSLTERAMAAVIGGAPLAVWATHLSESDHAIHRLRRTAWGVTLWLTLFAAFQGALVASGLRLLTPWTITIGVVLLIAVAARRAARRSRLQPPSVTPTSSSILVDGHAGPTPANMNG